MYEKFAYEGNEAKQVFIKDFGVVVLLDTATYDHFNSDRKVLRKKFYISSKTFEITPQIDGFEMATAVKFFIKGFLFCTEMF